MAASDTSLALPVPGGGDAASTSRAFHFPYSVAYDIQLQLMTRLFETIEQGHIGVFESPTGTVRHTLIQGKTLSLLCSAFTWLEQNRRRAQVGTLSAEDSEEPEWVVAHDQARQRETLEAHDAELAAKLREIRHQRTSHAPRETTKRRVRLTLLTQRVDDGDDSDSDYLVADYDEHRRRAQPNDQAYLSDEVRRMMQALESCSDASKTEEETAITPKIYYASRTHSQLTQLIHELKRTPFGSDTHDPVRSISLGSRKQMCIHSQVQRIGATFGTEAMNERCLELMESGSTSRRLTQKSAARTSLRRTLWGKPKWTSFATMHWYVAKPFYPHRRTFATLRNWSRWGKTCTHARTLAHAEALHRPSWSRFRTTCCSSRMHAMHSHCR